MINVPEIKSEAIVARKLIEGSLEDCAFSTRNLAETIFPDIFYTPFSVLHDQMLDVIDSDDPFVVLAAPRGIGKSTLARTLAARAILYRLKHFIVYVSFSATLAEMQTENLKRELLSNSRVKEYFGSIKASDLPSEMDDSFSKLAWVAFGQTFILPRGSGQQIRGLNWNNHRPDLIIIDDLEDREEVRNPSVRASQKEWFFSDLLKCVDRYKNDFKVVYIDTLKHPDSLLASLLKSPSWKSVRLSICDADMRSFAPSYMSDTEVRKELKRHRDDGLAHVFFMEYMNLTTSPDDAAFRSEYFKYYRETDESFQNELIAGEIESVVIVDPAKTHELHAAYSAVVCWGVNRNNNRLYFRDVVARKMYPDELYDETIQMCLRHKAKILGVEVTSLHEFITFPLKNEISKRGLYFELIELKARRGTGEYAEKNRGKEGRVAALVPEYRQGRIYHNEEVALILEEQLLSFPRPERWDVMDAAAYIIEMLEEGQRYFLPNEETLYDVPESEYEELALIDEPPPKEDWRFY